MSLIRPRSNPTRKERRPIWGIVLSAGSGDRFGGQKQFAKAAGRRLVDYAVQATIEACDRVVLVCPAGHKWDGAPVNHVVTGGVDRRSSVRAALDAIPDLEGIVLVHQAANPLADPATFAALIGAVNAGAPAAVPGLRPPDLVRRRDGEFLGDVVGRDALVLIQTPAAFRLRVIRAAHALDVDAVEDTALVTAAGYPVQIVPGDPRNVHVATPADLEVVEALLLARRL